jgi:hypothetical protein
MTDFPRHCRRTLPFAQQRLARAEGTLHTAKQMRPSSKRDALIERGARLMAIAETEIALCEREMTVKELVA